MHPIAYFYPSGHAAHAEHGHPERPERVEAIVETLDQAGLWQAYPHLTPLDVGERILLGVHTRRHLETIEAASHRGGRIDADTYLTTASWELALNAAGGACSVAAAVWDRGAARGFALCRPPGHHATPDRAMGFCLLNNIAVAAEYLLQEAGAQKLAIVDIDLHHGNGTQDIFYERPEVLFISLHQHPLYPGTGMLGETGRGPGAGTTVNLPLPPYCGDTAFAAAVETAILPALVRFEPDMLLVSAGLDVHWRDPLGHLQFSAAGYHAAVSALAKFADDRCGGRIALVLEGGYDLTGGAACALGAASALLARPFTDPLGPAPYPETERWLEVIAQVRKIHGLD
ncbi:MAG TPA: histone deacetylase [Anaerolineales bacterium]|nr:histone deacetylase [Anaerolineales bacterium]